MEYGFRLVHKKSESRTTVVQLAVQQIHSKSTKNRTVEFELKAVTLDALFDNFLKFGVSVVTLSR
jgi:hypothetical protein